ncbi:MAG TPA: hypothetical protein VF121_06300 [Thermoanaerobaculia bacterium]|nr:hypothetical protein [Thermoanaerobaculia bacterium]
MERDDFRPEDEAQRRLWEALARLPEEAPGPGLRRRFYRMLEEETAAAAAERSPARAGRWRDRLLPWLDFPRPAFGGLAWALPALAIGVLVGALLPGRAAAPQRDVAALRQEVTSLSRLVALSLLEQDSASERLKGVSYGREAGLSDPRVLDALLAAVAHDENDNVRLAAIDALADVAGRPGVQRELIDGFPRQQSPLVQIALVDLLAEARGARPRLRKLADDPAVDPTVRDYLRRRLERT